MELLKKLVPYLLIIRPKNLLLIGLTQCIIYYYMFNKFEYEVALSGKLLYLFIINTIVTSAGGYIINDIIDNKADAINKPHKTYLPEKISIISAYRYYYLILIVGLILCIFISLKTTNPPLVIVYIIACCILYLYSKKYKNTVLIGNIIVSFFVAFVPGIILITEKTLLFEKLNQQSQNILLQLLFFYISFSFLINLIREIIKDIEDIDGDYKIGCVTLPIKYGITTAKIWCISLAVLTILALVGWIASTNIALDFRVQVYLLLFVAAPLVIIIQILTKTTIKRDFSKISSILKWIMLAGLGALILISKTMA